MKQLQTQVLVNEDISKFILVNKNKNLTTIFSPFEVLDNEYQSNFVLPENRSFRALKLKNLIPNLCHFESSNKQVNVDCIKCIDPSLFNNIKNGYIYLAVGNQNKKIKNKQYKNIIEAKNILIYDNCKSKFNSIEFELSNKIKFKTQNLKIFPIITNNGFLLLTIDNEETTLYLSVENAKDSYIGSCIKSVACEIVRLYLNIWPILNIDITAKSSEIYLDIPNLIFEEENSVIFKLTRKLNSKNVKIEKIGM